jgi:DNA-binding MarR family transcriptional regulator
MERDGWIARHDCPGDRRKKLIRMTSAAEPVWNQIVECAARVRQRATQGLSERQLAMLKKILATVRQNLQRVEPTVVADSTQEMASTLA